ncbi:AraC family transcriptional regulator [Cupriavidus pauculus]|uniref:AraC family transcriptional regulator n=1 Tax=Cupriavidus pauculus TaxID=82633 RepID=A0A3G8H140_9BURK|nr:AraC family transcriptional regulator [Cupriavidus pauculus]
MRANPLPFPPASRAGDGPSEVAWSALGADLRVAVVDGTLAGHERRESAFGSHVALALMVEGAGHFQMEGHAQTCPYRDGCCYLSCAWEGGRGVDLFTGHSPRRVVLLQYRTDWLSLFDRTGPAAPPGGLVHSHPWRQAWVLRMPMPPALRNLAHDLLANGAPRHPLDRLRTKSRALGALATLAEWAEGGADADAPALLQPGVESEACGADCVPGQVCEGDDRRGSSDRPLTGRQRRQLCAARHHIHANCLEPLTVGGVARAVGLGEAALRNGFRALFGCTVYDYVLERRLAEAARLLRENGLSVAEVAWRSGFSHASHLSRHFRRRYGMSPGDYRSR